MKNKFFNQLFIFLIFILIWEFAPKFLNIPTYLIPSFHEVVIKFKELSWHLLSDTIVTFGESLGGFLLGSICGILIGILISRFLLLEDILMPYIVAIKTIPIVAIAPLLIVWFGNGIFPKIVISALISFFPLVINTFRGLTNIQREAIDYFRSLAASRWQIFSYLQIFYALPYIFSGLKIASTLSVIGAIVGEFSGADKGIGFLILISSHRLDTPALMVGIIISSLIGIFMFKLLTWIEKKVGFWQPIETI